MASSRTLRKANGQFNGSKPKPSRGKEYIPTARPNIQPSRVKESGKEVEAISYSKPKAMLVESTKIEAIETLSRNISNVFADVQYAQDMNKHRLVTLGIGLDWFKKYKSIQELYRNAASTEEQYSSLSALGSMEAEFKNKLTPGGLEYLEFVERLIIEEAYMVQPRSSESYEPAIYGTTFTDPLTGYSKYAQWSYGNYKGDSYSFLALHHLPKEFLSEAGEKKREEFLTTLYGPKIPKEIPKSL